jgi:DNA-directed RNA polymerase specialized sigma24 family protein
MGLMAPAKHPAVVLNWVRWDSSLGKGGDSIELEDQSFDCGSVTQFFGQLRTGSPAAAEALWERFFPRLVGLARKTLVGRPQRMADADDAAQSAFASFCLRVKAGEYNVGNRNDLWNLLGVITVNKARMQARREAATKRGGGRVIGEDALARPDGSPLPLDEVAVVSPAEFDLHCEELLGQLEPQLREFALLRLLGYRNREIAEMHDCTERKVERKLNLIRLRWQAAWPGDAE